MHKETEELQARLKGLTHGSAEALRLCARWLALDPSVATISSVVQILDRLFHADAASDLPAPYAACRVAVQGNVTTNYLINSLRAACLTEGWIARVHAGGFDQYRQELLAPQGALQAFDPQVLILALDWRDILPEVDRVCLAGDQGLLQRRIEEEAGQLAALLTQFRQHSKAAVLLTGPVRADHTPLGFLDAGHPRGVAAVHDALRLSLETAVAQIQGVYVQQTDRVLGRVGRDRAFSPKMRYLARMPWSPDGLRALAADFAVFIRQALAPARKCLVLDLDNTLWGGIIGEDGLEGIKLGPDGVGRAFVDFQHEILRLHRQGVILAVCSKNNEADVQEVFARHPAMVLKPAHFAAMRVNWADKASNFRELAAEINIGLDSMVFLDDNPAERDIVRQLLPQVLTPDLPKDAVDYPGFLRALNCFQTLQLTEDDLQRGRFYADERQRKALQQQSGSLEDYLRSLNMTADIRPIDDFTAPRVVQLLARTNQFNLTTRRHGEVDIARMRQSKEWHVFSLRLEDRYGDSGIVGAAILHLIPAVDGSAAVIDSLLMSCRVLGRGVETLLLAHLAAFAASRGAKQVVGQYIPTEKNAQAADFYPRHGFEPLEADGSLQQWQWNCGERALEAPNYIRLTHGT